METLSTDTTGANSLPVEIVHDIICYVFSSYYWSYFIEGEIVYHQSQNGHDIDLAKRILPTTSFLNGGSSHTIWEPVAIMTAINKIFRDETLPIASKILGIPRGADGRLLERPGKILERIYDLRARLNLHSYGDRRTGTRMYADSNPWADKHTLVGYVKGVLGSGYVCRSPYLRGYTALLVGTSALKALSFQDIMDGRAFRERRVNDPERRRSAAADDDELSLAAWTLDLINQTIDPLANWNPKQACAHLAQGLFSVAYSLHTASSVCGIVGMIISCTKLLKYVQAAEEMNGVSDERRQAVQTANRACTTAIKQLIACEASSYKNYKSLGTPIGGPPPWPSHLIPHEQILEYIIQAGCENLAPKSMRCHLLRIAILWRIRITVPELASVFPEDLLLWYLDGSVTEGRLWGGIANSSWNGTREDLQHLWAEYKQEYIHKFDIDGNTDICEAELLTDEQGSADL